MIKRFLALFLAAMLSVVLLGYWQTVQAQTPDDQPLSTPIALAFNPELDSSPAYPTDRDQSDKPYDDDGRVVIGIDDRTPAPILTRRFPWSAIGRLEWSEPPYIGSCTGALVGRDLVLTNAHCMIDETTGQLRQSRTLFKPSMIEGVALDEAVVISSIYGTTSPHEDLADDWALLKLDQPLGDIYGYMGWRTLDFSDETVLAATADKLLLAGYSGDFPTPNFSEFGQPGETAGVHRNCSILGTASAEENQEFLLHECDTNPGASGSPIFALFDDDNYYIVGLHAGSLPLNRRIQLPTGDITNVINRGVEVSRWAQQARSMRS